MMESNNKPSTYCFNGIKAELIKELNVEPVETLEIPCLPEIDNPFFEAQFEFADDIEVLERNHILKGTPEITIGMDLGNGESLTATGKIEKTTNAVYKRRKKGKKYKLYLLVKPTLCEYVFVANNVIFN